MKHIIHTKRLTLAPWQLEHAAPLAELAGNPAIARMTGSIPSPYSKQEAEDWIHQAKLETVHKRLFAYGIFNQSVPRLLGGIALYPSGLLVPNKQWAIGFWLGQAFWRKGFMSESITVILDYAHLHLTGQILQASVFKDNPASMALLERHKFERSSISSEVFSVARNETVPTVTFYKELKTHHSSLNSDALK